MHLLATTSGIIDGSPEAVDLNQSPADVVVVSAAIPSWCVTKFVGHDSINCSKVVPSYFAGNH